MSIYRRGGWWWSRIEHGGSVYQRTLRTKDRCEAHIRDKSLKDRILLTGSCPRTFHPRGMSISRRKWRLANPGKTNLASRRRRAHKLGSPVHFTLAEWETLKRQLDNRCVGCHRHESELAALGLRLAPDHIIPLTKGGLDDITNIQPLCHGRKRGARGGCNQKKGAKYWDYLIS